MRQFRFSAKRCVKKTLLTHPFKLKVLAILWYFQHYSMKRYQFEERNRPHPRGGLSHLLTDAPRAQDHILVDQGCDDSTDDRPNPVNEIFLPETASQGWAEGARRIHRCTRHAGAHQDIY